MTEAMDDAPTSDDPEPDNTTVRPGNGASPPEPRPDEAPPAAPSLPPEAGYSGPLYTNKVKLLVAFVGAAAVASMTWLYLYTVDDDESSTSPTADVQGVNNVSPVEGSQVPEQSRIVVELAPGWDGALTVDGIPIPDEDLVRGRQQDRNDPVPESTLEFAPAEGSVMETLPAGDVCVNVEAWRYADEDDGPRNSLSWCFTVF